MTGPRTVPRDDQQRDYVRLMLAVRRQRRWTQAQLATELCVSRLTVQRWESEQQEPRPSMLLVLRALLAEAA